MTVVYSSTMSLPRNILGFFQRWQSWDRDDAEVLFSAAVTFAAVVGIVGLIITTDLTRNSLTETRRATANSERAARIDQRAWLSFAFGGETHLPVTDDRVDIRLPLQNTGRTPAFDVRSVVLTNVPLCQDS